MITSLRLRNFKNFADETLHLGPFSVIVGANASGKSNVRDALRFLHGIGRGYTLADIIGGRYGLGGNLEWSPLCGAFDEIIRFGKRRFGVSVTLEIVNAETNPGPPTFPPTNRCEYRIRIDLDEARQGAFRVTGESLQVESRIIYTSHPLQGAPVCQQDDDAHLLLRMEKTGGQRKYGARIAVRPEQPALTQIREHRQVVRAHKTIARSVVEVLGSIRFVDPSPDHARQPAFPGHIVLGDKGENLPTVLQEICQDSDRSEMLTDWTQELTPMDVDGFEFPVDPSHAVHLVIREKNGRRVSAASASDGTMRCLIIMASLLQPKPGGIHVFGEIDNGIHPSRQHLLLDLIEGQVADDKMQVVTTTHSPQVLAMMNDDTFASSSVICRRSDASDAVIRRLADLPDARELRTSQGLGRLHASGWMEDMIELEDREGADEA